MTGLETPGLGGMRGEGDQADDVSIAQAGVEEDRLDEEQQVGAGGMEEDQRRQLDNEQLVRAGDTEEDRRAVSNRELVARAGAPATAGWTGGGGRPKRGALCVSE
jgi:hypothetical protein